MFPVIFIPGSKLKSDGTFLNLSKCSPVVGQQHQARRMIFLAAPLQNHNKVTRALNPWDEKIALEGTGKDWAQNRK